MPIEQSHADEVIKKLSETYGAREDQIKKALKYYSSLKTKLSEFFNSSSLAKKFTLKKSGIEKGITLTADGVAAIPFVGSAAGTVIRSAGWLINKIVGGSNKLKPDADLIGKMGSDGIDIFIKKTCEGMFNAEINRLKDEGKENVKEREGEKKRKKRRKKIEKDLKRKPKKDFKKIIIALKTSSSEDSEYNDLNQAQQMNALELSRLSPDTNYQFISNINYPIVAKVMLEVLGQDAYQKTHFYKALDEVEGPQKQLTKVTSKGTSLSLFSWQSDNMRSTSPSQESLNAAYKIDEGNRCLELACTLENQNFILYERLIPMSPNDYGHSDDEDLIVNDGDDTYNPSPETVTTEEGDIYSGQKYSIYNDDFDRNWQELAVSSLSAKQEGLLLKSLKKLLSYTEIDEVNDENQVIFTEIEAASELKIEFIKAAENEFSEIQDPGSKFTERLRDIEAASEEELSHRMTYLLISGNTNLEDLQEYEELERGLDLLEKQESKSSLNTSGITVRDSIQLWERRASLSPRQLNSNKESSLTH